MWKEKSGVREIDIRQTWSREWERERQNEKEHDGWSINNDKHCKLLIFKETGYNELFIILWLFWNS